MLFIFFLISSQQLSQLFMQRRHSISISNVSKGIRESSVSPTRAVAKHQFMTEKNRQEQGS